VILFEGAIVFFDESDGFVEGIIVRSKKGVLVGKALGKVNGVLLCRIFIEALRVELGIDVEASDGPLLGRIVGGLLRSVLGMDV